MTRRYLMQLLASTTAFGGSGVSLIDIRNQGARGDGKTNDAAAIQKAIDACTGAGGGVVYFPPGTYVSGTLFLKNHVTLHLSPGATLRASRNLADYEPRHLIYARDASQIAIEGGGMIDGQGDMSWDANFRRRTERLGPLIELVGCRDVRIQEVHIRNSPRWTIHPKNCDRVWIRAISIITDLRGPNTDGIDPDSSRNVLISDCYIETGDDCIVLKTTKDLPWIAGGYGEPVQPCENVTVTNCTLITTASALKLGTESFAGIRHCVFSNCVIGDSSTGITLFAKDGGTFEDVSFSNISVQTRPETGARISWPIAIDLEKRWKDSAVGAIRDVSFSDIEITTSGRVLVAGMPERPLENISFRNIRMRVSGFEPVERAGKPRGGTAQPASREADYGPVPSAMIFANIRDLDIRDVRVCWDAAVPPQERHAVYAARIDGLRIDGFTGRHASPAGNLATISLNDSRNVFIARSRAEQGTNVFLHLEGTAADEVMLAANDLRLARRQMQ